MQKILELLESQKNWKEFLKKNCRKNLVTVDIAAYFTPLKMKTVYQRFENIYVTQDANSKSCWLQNELKAFYWTIIAISGLKQKLIEDFTFTQWSQLSQIFKNKNKSIMEYQAIKLVNQRISKNRQWAQQQVDILTSIISQNKESNKWNDIARTLFYLSKNKYFRSGKQCRQRWLNHLDPTKKRGEWTEEEDIYIANFILAQGKRWSTIARQLGSHRTEHMVKNRYKTITIKQKKVTNKVMSQTNSLKQFLKGLNVQVQQSVAIKKEKKGKKQSKQYIFDVEESNLMKNESQKQEQEDQDQCELEEDLDIAQVNNLPQSPKKVANIKITDQSQSLKDSLFKEEIKSNANTQNIFQTKYDKDPIISGLIQQYSRPSQNNYELQQICSPWYMSYQAITPNYFSPSPSLPFFLNSSFSAFQNPNLFLRNNNPKNDEKQ